jgi:G:T-mismatch repair DNA endonuclease (very short patch repair protein)
MPEGKQGFQKGNSFAFKIGKLAWNRGLTKETDVRVAKNSASNVGKKRSDDTRKLISIKAKERELNPEYKHKVKLIHQDPEWVKNQSATTKKYWQDPKLRKNRSNDLKKQWKDPKWAKNAMSKSLEANMTVRPNKPEKQVIQILKSLSSSIKYVGDGRCWISGMNPDFVDAENMKIIEVLGCYWHGCSKHSPDLKKQRHNTSRINKFKRLGYLVLTIWECELKHPQKVMMKIQKLNCTT